MKRIFSFIVSLMYALFVLADIPASTNKFVNDFASVLDSSTIETIETRLKAYSDSTSNQIIIVTVNNLDDKTPAEYAQELGQEWGIWGKDNNNGIIILIKPKQLFSNGQIFIATKYGMEDILPATICKRIIDTKMIPYFRMHNNYDGAVNSAVDEIIFILDNDSGSMSNTSDNSLWYVIIFVLIILIFFIIIICSDNFSSKTAYCGDDYGSFDCGTFDSGSFDCGGAGGSW